jgi:D-lactate dehydrogenase (cytochrome)
MNHLVDARKLKRPVPQALLDELKALTAEYTAATIAEYEAPP